VEENKLNLKNLRNKLTSALPYAPHKHKNFMMPHKYVEQFRIKKKFSTVEIAIRIETIIWTTLTRMANCWIIMLVLRTAESSQTESMKLGAFGNRSGTGYFGRKAPKHWRRYPLHHGWRYPFI
jgi:hypothetical protein